MLPHTVRHLGSPLASDLLSGLNRLPSDVDLFREQFAASPHVGMDQLYALPAELLELIRTKM